MDLFSKAQSVASAARAEEEKSKENSRKQHEVYQRYLDEMKAKVLSEIKQLDGKETKYGKFNLEIVNDQFNAIAYLTCDTKLVAWFKAKVEYHNDTDYGDMVYKKVSARFYPPYPKRDHDGSWDIQELKYYFNGGQQISAYSLKDMDKFFNEMVGLISQWM